jgi:hypothetical protein
VVEGARLESVYSVIAESRVRIPSSLLLMYMFFYIFSGL